MKYYYNITESENGFGFTLTFPNVPEAVTCGATREEVISYAEDCLRTALTFYTDKNESLPEIKTVTDSFVDVINIGYDFYVSYAHSKGFGGISIETTKNHISPCDVEKMKNYIEEERNCEDVIILNIIALPIKLNPIEDR